MTSEFVLFPTCCLTMSLYTNHEKWNIPNNCLRPRKIYECMMIEMEFLHVDNQKIQLLLYKLCYVITFR